MKVSNSFSNIVCNIKQQFEVSSDCTLMNQLTQRLVEQLCDDVHACHFVGFISRVANDLQDVFVVD